MVLNFTRPCESSRLIGKMSESKVKLSHPSLALTHTHRCTPTLTRSRSHTSHTHCYNYAHIATKTSLFLSQAHSWIPHSDANIHSHSISLTHTHIHSLSHTHKHTCSHTHMHTHKHTRTHAAKHTCPSQKLFCWERSSYFALKNIRMKYRWAWKWSGKEKTTTERKLTTRVFVKFYSFAVLLVWSQLDKTNHCARINISLFLAFKTIVSE